MRRDDAPMGLVADLSVRLRMGRQRGLDRLGRASIFEPVLREVVSMADVQEEDNVVLLGAADTRPAEWLAPACRRLTVVDDLPDDRLREMERGLHQRGHRNVGFQWGRAGNISTPQYTNEKVVCVNFLFRARDPGLTVKQIFITSRHGARAVICEPSASLETRTARKYSREAQLSMEDHRALVGFARAAAAHRGFTREGMESMMARSGFVDVEIRDLLHGLVVAARGTVKV